MLKMKAIGVFLAAALLTGCASMSTMQTARTTPKGEVVGLLGAGVVNSEFALGELDTISINAPFLEVGGRYGINEKLDLGIKLTIIGTAVADVKYQFLGSQESKLAGSVGFGLGYLSIESGGSTSKMFDIMTPLYFSYHPAEWFSIYASPRYVFRINSYATEDNAETGSGSSHWYGTTGGIRLGNRVGFMAEYSYFGNSDLDEPFSQITCGFSFKLN